jgi:hypothetical protein
MRFARVERPVQLRVPLRWHFPLRMTTCANPLSSQTWKASRIVRFRQPAARAPFLVAAFVVVRPLRRAAVRAAAVDHELDALPLVFLPVLPFYMGELAAQLASERPLARGALR